MRHLKTSDWVQLLPKAVELLNARPMTRNGGIAPEAITSFYQDPLLRSARRIHHVKFPEPNLEEEQSSNSMSEDGLEIGSYVFLDKKQRLFDKSFLLKVKNFQHFVYIKSRSITILKIAQDIGKRRVFFLRYKSFQFTYVEHL